ncbi:MAG: bifunctional phosphopantothenoylcysteine decarboxylase/phosphopantothenate--cysteine ligase CoaBC [Bdellovibrionota bacterium]
MKVLVAVCGSIAAYRSVDFVRELKSRGHDIKVLLTHGAEQFVSARVFETFLGELPLSNDVFATTHAGTDHIAVARWAERVIVYGATAHFLASYRAGSAEDFLQTQLLAFRGDVCVMPAMNPSMWSHPATLENCRVLESRGVKFWGPVGGRVACGEEGVGHLIPPSEAFALFDTMSSKVSATTDAPRVFISMGPMRSRMDAVRYLQNESSGRMGLALVEAWKKSGSTPKVLLGPVEETIARDVEGLVGRHNLLRYIDDRDYARALETESALCDVFFSAAAVLDFAFEVESSQKFDKDQIGAGLALRPVEDFAASFGRQKKDDQWLVSFSAEVETDDRALLEKALSKKLSKNADWTLVNRVAKGSGPHASSSEAWILDQDQGIVYLGESRSKTEIAEQLVSEIRRVWMQTRDASTSKLSVH